MRGDRCLCVHGAESLGAPLPKHQRIRGQAEHKKTGTEQAKTQEEKGGLVKSPQEEDVVAATDGWHGMGLSPSGGEGESGAGPLGTLAGRVPGEGESRNRERGLGWAEEQTAQGVCDVNTTPYLASKGRKGGNLRVI